MHKNSHLYSRVRRFICNNLKKQQIRTFPHSKVSYNRQILKIL
jgi:hypothetical protein